MQYKDIDTNSGTIRYTYNNDVIELKQIEYAFKNNDGGYIKFLIITKQMDITLSGFSLEDEDVNEIDFEILENDIIYPILINFLKGDETLVINSDDTRKTKYITFIKQASGILIKIVNNIPCSNITNKFNIFIKDIYEFDLRSKIDLDSQDFKNRFLKLFDDIQKLFEEYNDYEMPYSYEMKPHNN